MANPFGEDDLSDDEFEIESDVTEDSSTMFEKLSQFSYYLVENFEFNLDFCLNLLEEKNVPTKSNSIHTTVLSNLLSAVPSFGKSFGAALAKGEIFVFQKMDKKNSRILADLVYYYSDHKDAVRLILIEAAVDLFCSFEQQFRKLSCKEGHKRAMYKLAKDATDRIFSYFLETEQKRNVTRTEIVKGILFGNSKRNNLGMRDGRTVVSNDVKWKSSKLYLKTGILDVAEKTFYKNENSHTEKYGYRRLFSWESIDDIKINWEEEQGSEPPQYTLEETDDLITSIRNYVMSKNARDEAKLERENYNKEASEDRRLKQEEVLNKFQEKFEELLEDLDHQYHLIKKNEDEQKILLETVSEKQTVEMDMQIEIKTKLQEIHQNVTESRRMQDILLESNNDIQQNIHSIKHTQEATAVLVTQIKTEKEVPKNNEMRLEEIQDGLKEVVREVLRKNDPSQRVKNEVKRTLRKLKL